MLRRACCADTCVTSDAALNHRSSFVEAPVFTTT